MTEFARLLRDAAGQPPRPLMMDAIRHRARRSLRRRVGLGLVGLGALAGLSAPAGLSLLPAGDRPAGVETIGVEPDRGQPTPSTGRVESRPSHESVATSVPARSDSTPVAPDIGARTSRRSTDGTSAAGTASRPGAVRASSCWVDNLWLYEPAGESKRCEFTATAAGGWNFYQERGSTSPLGSEIVTADVYVTRNGVTTAYWTREVETASGSRTEGCADDVIQPGDLVEVVLSASEDDTPLDVESDAAAAVGAGQGWGCSDPGQPSWATDDDGGA